MNATMPDSRGYFGEFGGRFVPETLVGALEELTAAFDCIRCDERSRANSTRCFETSSVGRRRCSKRARLTVHAKGARIFLKREDLNHTGAHKINNAIGQALLARQMGKPRVIAETGAGQHGVAMATAVRPTWARMPRLHGRGRHRRQRLNVFV